MRAAVMKMKATITRITICATIAALPLTHCVLSGGSGQPAHGHSPIATGEKSDHPTGGHPNMSITNFFTTSWEFFTARNTRTPEAELPTRPVDLSQFIHAGGDQLRVTWLGHSSLMINIDGFRILTDPVFQKRVSILGPTRFNGEVPLEIGQLPEIDAVIISHDHYDHLNKHAIRLLRDKVGRFIVPIGVGARLEQWGVPGHQIIELDWWQEHYLDNGLMAAATPAQHFSGRGLTDRNQTLWASWVIEAGHHRIFFSGDSGYFDGFKKIGTVYGPFDMTFIECGAYNPAWAEVHMFPEQTVQAHLDLNGQLLHPIHWGTFNLSLHPWHDPMERLTAAAAARGVATATPIVGDTTIFGERIPTAHWWRDAMKAAEVARQIPLPYVSATAAATATAKATAKATATTTATATGSKEDRR
jgi:L-ascorbate metabolism protein UlaG (beta-lactamase superfamily)